MILRALPSVLVCSISLSLQAQQASYTNYGQGCGFGPILPQAMAVGLPRLGSTCYVYYQTSSWFKYPTSGTVVLITGVSRSSWGGLSLPFTIPHLDPYGYGFPVCQLLASPEFIPYAGSSGALVPFQIPNNPTLLGVALYQQWLIWVEERDPTGFNYYFLVSNGGEMKIGL